ncbi:DNA topoisomerase IB [Erythrobacteraceae bacterium CFH 75059]|uniref:DNA topoisomerase IB n=1 Tax=Qipengyuania thermophila TaxID=2509361 RepID=UPI00101EBE55|nr:DNA topoisomerase IB [Qipengyuania thermophila]TCD05555.1 DNA topoisomerase IB [Erythrobacteraceae bacterium CFH 75059]
MDVDKAPLIFVDDELPGITRRRSGKGWAYFDAEGRLISDRRERERLNRIALPPAYRDAWFCPAPNGHILATGIDAKGRKQYRYHPEFRAHRESVKYDGCATFGKLLPLVRMRVEKDLAQRRITRERAIAGVVRLLDLGALRVGNECYAQSNKSFGATTLRGRHAKVVGDTLRIRFKGKHGVLRDLQLTDRRLAKVVRGLQDLPGQRLFRYLDEEQNCHDVDSSDVNEYLRETMGEGFTAKMFRTWHGSVIGFETLASSTRVLTIKELTQSVADRLGNTPAVTRRSYIHPAVFSVVEQQEEWRAQLRLPRATRWLSRHERGLIALLEESPDAMELLSAA